MNENKDKPNPKHIKVSKGLLRKEMVETEAHGEEERKDPESQKVVRDQSTVKRRQKYGKKTETGKAKYQSGRKHAQQL